MRARGKFPCIFLSWRLFIIQGFQPTRLRMCDVQLIFREKAKHVLQLHLCSTRRTAILQTQSPSPWIPWSPVLVWVASGDPQDIGPLSGASPGNFLPLLSHHSSLGDMSSVCPNSFHPRSSSVPVGLFAMWRAGKHFGSELRVIYLKCEHLSEAADGGNRVELPELRAGSISFKCKVHTI